jgi:hypothetical protein
VEEILETHNNNSANKHVFETHNNNVKGNNNRSVKEINNIT